MFPDFKLSFGCQVVFQIWMGSKHHSWLLMSTSKQAIFLIPLRLQRCMPKWTAADHGWSWEPRNLQWKHQKSCCLQEWSQHGRQVAKKTPQNSKRKDIFHLLCYRVLGFRLISGWFVTSYLEADIKNDPSLALIVVLWQHSQRNPSTLQERRNKFSSCNLGNWEGLQKSLPVGRTELKDVEAKGFEAT